MPFPIKNIQKLCDNNGETFKSLENKFGFGNSTIKRWENAKKLPPYERVKMIADYFHVSVYELSDGLFDEPNEDNKKTATIGDGHSAPIESKTTVNSREELKRLIDRLTDQEVSDLLKYVKKIILG